MATGVWNDGADVRVLVSSGGQQLSATAAIEPGTRATTVHVPVGATDRGPWQVAVRASHADHVIDTRTEIVPPSTSFVGSPKVFRGTAAPRVPLRPVADFQFRRTERLHVEWPALKAIDERIARLLDRRGQPMALNL